VKRLFDVVVSSFALLVLSPLFVIVALLIKLTSRGPVFYRAKRVGKGGTPLEVLKFRSMREGLTGPGITAKADPRVTAIGRWLRKLKIDELPQFINVLRGDMSIVGPRPEDPHYVALYTPEQRRVLSVLPGITSAASVAYRNEEEMLEGADWETTYVTKIMPEKLRLELEYIDRKRAGSDMMIIMRTVAALFR
jgi:lipopolysaccharide/colanic/teichoic acid biosynthesis glycosyltransferase